MLNALSANEFYTNHMTTFLCHVTTSFGHHVISFLQPTVQNSNGGFTTLVILIVSSSNSNCLISVNKPICYSTCRESFKKSFCDIVPDISKFSTLSADQLVRHWLRALGCLIGTSNVTAVGLQFLPAENTYLKYSLASRLEASKSLSL